MDIKKSIRSDVGFDLICIVKSRFTRQFIIVYKPLTWYPYANLLDEVEFVSSRNFDINYILTDYVYTVSVKTSTTLLTNMPDINQLILIIIDIQNQK